MNYPFGQIDDQSTEMTEKMSAFQQQVSSFLSSVYCHYKGNSKQLKSKKIKMCHSNQRKWESNRRKYSVLDQFIFSQLLQFVCFVRLWYYLSLRKHLVQTLAYIIPGLGRIMFTIKKPLWSSFGIRLKLLQRVLMWLIWSAQTTLKMSLPRLRLDPKGRSKFIYSPQENI